MLNKQTIRLTPFCEMPPQVSAFSWSLHQLSNGLELSSKSNYERLEIASLTKIMTAYVAVAIAETIERDPETILIVVPPCFIRGTTAQLKPGDLLSLHDLLYAMLLPSGNDAAIAIANWGGEQVLKETQYYNSQFETSQIMQEGEANVPRGLLHQNSRPTLNLIMNLSQEDTRQTHDFNKISHEAELGLNLSRFVKEMNYTCQKIGMRDTQFSNAHGLASKANKSTAFDLCRLCSYFLKNQLLRKIVRTKSYSKKTFKAIYDWQNTNLLLNNSKCLGLKTGFTPNAGACLAVLFDIKGKKDNNDLDGCVILVLLGAKDQFRRFTEAERLLQWAEQIWGNPPRKPRTAADSCEYMDKKQFRLKSGTFRVRRTGSKYNENMIIKQLF